MSQRGIFILSEGSWMRQSEAHGEYENTQLEKS
jgi:hypothetical protein